MSIHKFFLSAVLSLAVLLPVGSSGAQSTADDLAGAVDRQVGEAEMQALDPSLRSPVRRTTREAVIEASQDKTTASIEIRLKEAKSDQNRSSAIWTLKVSGAIDDKKSETSLVDLDGLVGKASASLGYHWRNGLDSMLDSLQGADKTTNQSEKIWCALVFAKVQEEPSQTADGSLASRVRGLTCRELNDRVNALIERTPKGTTPAFSTDLEQALWKYQDLDTEGMSPELKLKVIEALHIGTLWTFDLEGTYSPEQTFSFVTTDSLESQSEKHDGFSIAAGGSWLPSKSKRDLFAFSYRYQESHTASGKKQICTPFGSISDALSCSDQVVGAPMGTEKQVVTFEYRRFFLSDEDAARFWALTPRLSRDLHNDVTAFQLPFWVLTDGKNNLTGGLSLGWDSKTEDVAVTAFVGVLKNPLSNAGK